MKLIPLAAFLAVIFESLPKDVQDKLSELYADRGKPEMKQAIDLLTLQERSVIALYLKSYINDSGNWDKLVQTDTLIELGDDDTISREATSFPRASTGGASVLYNSIQPKVIIYLAPKIFSNEPFQMLNSGDTKGTSLSFEATEAIRRILARSPYLSGAVNAWAASWQFGQNPIRFREVLRSWWNANKQSVYNGNYSAVQPGEPPPVKGAAPVQRPSATYTSEPHFSATPPSTPAPFSSDAPLPPVSSNSIGLELALGVFAAITMGFLIFLRRKP